MKNLALEKPAETNAVIKNFLANRIDSERKLMSKGEERTHYRFRATLRILLMLASWLAFDRPFWKPDDSSLVEADRRIFDTSMGMAETSSKTCPGAQTL
ncbi:MAG: hypothetical protein AAFY41_17790 [Bacteroidota bacterium]